MDKVAIAEALKRFAAEEMKRVLPVEAQAKAHGVPVLGAIEDYRAPLAAIESGSADDCVTILAGGGASLKQGHDRIRKIAECLDEKGLVALHDARRAVGEVWNLLDAQARADLQPKADQLRELLSTEALLDSLSSIDATSREILGAYRTVYESRHADRTEQFQAAIEKIKGREEWTAVPEPMWEPVLAPLQSRCCGDLKLPDGSLTCETCRAGLKQMESDVAALSGLFAQVVAQVQKLITPPEVPLRRVRVAEFFAGAVEDEEQVRQAVARLQDHLLKLLSEGLRIVIE
jgi:hypothetical protein